MEAHGITLTEFINQGKKIFKIPLYQRTYNWKKSQCTALFKDICSISKKDANHFIGSIVFTEDVSLPEYNVYSVIDGQQRLTTIMLLLKALMDLSVDEDFKEEILESYLINKRIKEEYKIKLQLQKDDFNSYYNLLNDNLDKIKGSQVSQNYELFKDLISKTSLTHEEILRNIKRLNIVYVKILKDDENPQLIFESMNSTGLDLTQSDLIRNFLLMGLSLQDQDYFYNKYWLEIENLLTNDKISDFIRDYLTLKTGKIPNKGNVYNAFKDFFYNLKGQPIEFLFKELLTYAKYYSWFIFSNIDDEEIKSKLLNLVHLKSTVVYPFLLYLFYKYYNEESITKDELIKTIDIILSYLVRRGLCAMPTNALNKVFMTLAKDTENNIKGSISEVVANKLISKYGKSIFPNDTILEESLKNTNTYKLPSLKLVLEEIEFYKNKERVDLNNATVEHIMPQTLTPKWKKELGKNFEFVHEKYLDNIGNLTLSGYNSELSNSSFEEKSKIYSDSNISITRSIPKNYNKWTKKEILNRNKELLEDIKEIWPYPKNTVLPKTINIDDEIDLFDDFDFTNHKPLNLIISNTKYPVNSWKELLKFFAEYLYELDKEAFYSLIKDEDFLGKNKRYIDNNSLKMRSPIKVGKNLYIESNRNSNAIIEMCRKILNKFNNIDDTFAILLRK